MTGCAGGPSVTHQHAVMYGERYLIFNGENCMLRPGEKHTVCIVIGMWLDHGGGHVVSG